MFQVILFEKISTFYGMPLCFLIFQINTVIPPVPRCNVEELLALEGPKVFAQSGLSDKVTGNTAMSGRLDGTAALPPISPGPSELKTGEEEGKEEELLKTETSRQIDKDADAFFLTQVRRVRGTIPVLTRCGASGGAPP